ncbi:hypothetical protein [Allomuricauda sp. NBRC 101325]|uniref:hypothetical protein n=1 Tax=Allomuricauda sp. NBRC 101325 TaxID=1113758 RepID=UPI0025552D0E|nr:hypothetical protein [Muricauda sp. NBRC 101325]
MKKLLPIILLFCFSLTFSQEIKLVENKKYEGAIFSKSYTDEFSNFPPIEKRFTPTETEIAELENQLKKQIKRINKNKPNQGKHYGPIIHRNLKKYVRQYIGFIDNEGQKFIYVNFLWDGYSLLDFIRGFEKPDVSWKTEWQMWFDGGSIYWNIKYVIDKKEFVDFSVNGIA